MGADPANAALLLQQQQAFALMQTPQMPSMPGSKKQRELYVGNLPPESTELELTTLFTQLLSACDGYNPILGPPCPNASIAGGHTFAFVEFRDEQLCETAMQFNGITLHGRALKIGHPNGYIVPMMAAQGLKVPAELMEKLGLAASGALPPGSTDNKRQRELYVGNLTVGAVTAQMLKELFAVPLATIPGHDHSIPPVREARCDPSGKFAFVEFTTEALAATALQLFNGMELCGRDMKLARPAGYVAPIETIVPLTSAPAAPLRPLAPLAPLGGGGGGGAPPGAPTQGPPPAAVLAAEASKPTPTHVLCLRNLLNAEIMADAAEFAECVDDIRGECESFGKLSAFVVPTHDELHGHGAGDVGACFVKYEAVVSAAKAQDELDGRDFDGNSVSATFLPDDTM